MLDRDTLLHGRYRIEGVVAQGGMGIVYRARHEVLADRLVAVKEMSVVVCDDQTHALAVEQFRLEGRLLSSLQHPGLVSVLDSFEDEGAHYLVMEYVEGQTLEDVMLAGRPDHALILGWMDQICDALAYLHAQHPPVVYRDLKPSNVMLDRAGRIRLLDFGIARACAQGSQTGTFIRGAGTPGYAPVEQFGGGSTDPRADIYALGATLYSLLTGDVPPVSIDLMCGERRLVDPSVRAPGTPRAFDAAVRRMMAVQRADRPSSVEEVRGELRDVARTLGVGRSRELKVRRVVPPGRPTVVPRAATPLPMPVGPPTQRLEETPRESKWVAHLHDVVAEPPRPRRRASAAGMHVWLAQLALTLGLLAVTLPYYFPAFRVGVLAALNLPALLTGRMLSLMLDHSGVVAVIATLVHLGMPMALMQVFHHRRRHFAAMVCLVWLSANILELAVCLRYAHSVNLPFAVDFAHGWSRLLGGYGLSAQSKPLLAAMRFAGLFGMFTALTMMLWRVVTRSPRRTP